MTEDPSNLNTQAIELANRGSYVEAIACFKRAITMDRNNPLLWYNLGVTYRDANHLHHAKNALLTAYNLEPDDQDILETLAHVCFLLGESEEALGFCAHGLEQNIRNAHLWNNSGVVYFNQGDFESACEAFEHAVTIDPNYYDALYNLRDTYEQLGNKTAAKECTARIKTISPGDFYAR